jgi:hypothetical protein
MAPTKKALVIEILALKDSIRKEDFGPKLIDWKHTNVEHKMIY